MAIREANLTDLLNDDLTAMIGKKNLKIKNQVNYSFCRNKPGS